MVCDVILLTQLVQSRFSFKMLTLADDRSILRVQAVVLSDALVGTSRQYLLIPSTFHIA